MRDARRLTATRAAADQSFRLVALPTDEACLPGQVLRTCRSRRVGGRGGFCIYVDLSCAAGVGDLIAHLTVLDVRALARGAAIERLALTTLNPTCCLHWRRAHCASREEPHRGAARALFVASMCKQRPATRPRDEATRRLIEARTSLALHVFCIVII